MRALLAASLLWLLVGCQAEHFDRFEDKAAGFSVRQLDGWQKQRTHGGDMFVGPQSAGLEHTTIVVVSAPKTASDAPDQTELDVAVDATRRLLERLPSVKVLKEASRELHGFSGESFHLSFVPPGRNKRYEREHLVLVGERRVFHVIHTAPVGELQRSREAFSQVADSLKGV